jgi:RNA polymerase sigma factor (TIGR02999 family)
MGNSGTPTPDITAVLGAIERGEIEASNALFPEVYQELRLLAARKMAGEAPGHTLQPTALVHEAWLRIFGKINPHWENRAHFFAAAGEAMRRILVESARRKKRIRHGGQMQRVEMDEVDLPSPLPEDDLLALDEALNRLEEVDPRCAQAVKLCFFVGLTQEEAAKELGVSVSTVERNWAFARAWLFREIHKGRSGAC